MFDFHLFIALFVAVVLSFSAFPTSASTDVCGSNDCSFNSKSVIRWTLEDLHEFFIQKGIDIKLRRHSIRALAF